MQTERCIYDMNDIDYVVPMVFNDDPLWQQDFRRVGSVYDERNPYEFVRYRSWGTEELLIRCVRKFMPFVRTIYIILARESQRKKWMDGYGIKIVYHRDFIPEKYLPMFNSRSMEMFLHRIDGLSNLFLYGNDDMYPIAPLTEGCFFKYGLPCIKMKEKPYPENPNNFQQACMGGLNFIAGMFNLRYTTSWLKNGHSIAPMRKDTIVRIWEDHRNEIESRITPFREVKNFNQYIWSWWQYLSGNYVDSAPERRTLNVRKTVDEVAEAFHGSAAIVCINDNECEADYMKYAKVVRRELEKKLKD